MRKKTIHIHFTLREQQVIKNNLLEYSIPEIAKIMGIGLDSINKHLSNMYEKFDVPNLLRLILFALRNGFEINYKSGEVYYNDNRI